MLSRARPAADPAGLNDLKTSADFERKDLTGTTRSDKKDFKKAESAGKDGEKESGESGKQKGSKKSGKNRKGDQQKRMTSITRKLHWYGIRKKLLYYYLTDLLIWVLGVVGWCADKEYTSQGCIVLRNSRLLELRDMPGTLYYTVASPEGVELLSVPALLPLIIISSAAGILLALQMLGILFSYVKEDRKIRQIMAPINEIALKADELSRMSFSEDKYQVIEKALEKIEPDQAGEDSPLSFGDSDLSGVEAAMNNLLLRMRDSYRQQARFVNDASHELRTPIAVIQGYANMLDRWGKTDEKILEEGISAIKNESDHMNHLVEQLLFLARGDSGKTTLEKSLFSLNDMMQEIYEESFMIDEKHRYRLKLPGEQITIEADLGLLKQAVRILTDNAAKYTPEGEEIILSAGRNEEGKPYLQVQDLGIGIAESEIPHIFERFFRSDEVRASEGTGLGLSIAKWIVDKHGGYFEILSREELGTRIRIQLP